MTSAEQLYLSMCLDGLPISILGLSDSTLQLLQSHTVESIEHTARLTFISAPQLRNEVIDSIEHDLRGRLNEHTVHCYTLESDELNSQSQFVIESTLFHFVASIDREGQECTCVYRWSDPEWLSSVPFQDPAKLQPRQEPKSIREASPAGCVPTISPQWQTSTTKATNVSSEAQQQPATDWNAWPTQKPVIDETSPTQTDTQPAAPHLEVLQNLPEDIAAISIDHLELSTRTRNALIRADILTLRQLVAISDVDLLSVKNFGITSLQEVHEKLKNTDLFEELPFVKPNEHSSTLQQQYDITPDIAHISVDKLGLSNRTCRLLMQSGIHTLGDLAKHNEEELYSIQHLSQRRLREIHDRLSQIDKEQLLQTELDADKQSDTSKLEIENNASSETLQKTTVNKIIAQFLVTLNEREQQIIVQRYGLAGNKKLTLEEIGQSVGCTRERVRQIEKKALNKLRSVRNYRIIHPIILRLETILKQTYGVISTEAVIEILYDIPSDHAENTLLFILNFTDNVQQIKGLPILSLTDTPHAMFTQHISEICAVFKKVITEALAPIPVSDALDRFANDRKGRRLVEQVDKAFLVACVEAHPDVIIDEQKFCSLKQWSTKRLDDMVIVLREHGKPLHYSEIAERVNQRLPEDQQTTAHNFHAHMGRLPEVFVRVGHGIFGLAEWGLAQDKNLPDAAYRVLTEAGHALHIEALTDRVLETWHVKRNSVKAAIDLDDRIEQVGRNLYWLKDVSQTHTEAGETAQSDFDQMFGSLLLQRQQDLERDRINTEQTNDLEEIRRLDIDLLR
ncbi:MAG: sigma-70 family RNA polymerase sigma factor [Chloroflexota bacterium]